ncbi:glycosyltransferase family 9 protein [Pseudodesulfovibrio senegalensis]|uniref:Glycosyltransferase family 9 protein n=1 Tax=Pseudodesulfovibrio senegalensis TaxID=1721087 RepID=A0A6N6N0S7_9BACT|nr:glycosyltransferase family 9 protein [Pseudodesulfovibrio senegalensis]KAB1441094.1 glycosyltransferase family 9 protein [Pseudodesulfovibrio senegalensis]
MKKDISQLAPERILVCQQRQIGDVVLSTPAFTLLRRAYPQAELHLATEKKCVPVVSNNPNIDRIWAFDRDSGLLSRFGQLVEMRRTRFDLVIDFQQLPRCRTAVLASGASVRLSYPPKWYNRPLYTHWNAMDMGYAVKAKMSVMRPLGIEWNGERPRMYPTQQERNEAESFLDGIGIKPEHVLVTVDATHWSDARRWPAGHFSTLMNALLEERPFLRFLLLYGPGEKDQVQMVFDGVKRKECCHINPEVLQIRQTAAIMEHACLHLGNCSAPRHFALAVGTPTFTMVGSNSGFSWTFPSPDHDYIANRVDCWCKRDTCENGTFRCMTELLPETVLPFVLDKLPRSGDFEE